MAHLWVDVTYLDQAEYDSLIAAREEARRAAEEAASNDGDRDGS